MIISISIPEKEGNGKSTKLDAGSVVAADGAGTGGGQLWAYDPKGDVQMEVPQGAKLTGWPKLTPETMAPGFPHDIRHKFFEFDGVVPHAVLPYTGNQLSIVYFARSKYLTIDGQVPDDRWNCGCGCDWGCACSDIVMGLVLDLFWACYGPALGLSWACPEPFQAGTNICQKIIRVHNLALTMHTRCHDLTLHFSWEP